MNEYYVYGYLDPRKPGKYKYYDYEFNHEPFYIGKGKNSRILRHLKNNNRNKIKLNKIDKIRKEGFEPIIVKIVKNLTNEESLKIEKILIEKIGRYIKGEGPLTNYTKGGETYLGYKHKEDYLITLKKPVIKYDIHGNEIERYESVDEAGIKNNAYPQTISQVCSGKIKIFKNKYIFLYEGDGFKERKRNKKEYPVIKIGYDFKQKEYTSLHEASIDNKTTLARISSVCRGDRFQTGGYFYRFKNIKNYDSIINDKFSKYLEYMNYEIEYKNKMYKNILHVLFENNNTKVNNIYKLINK